MKKIYWIILIIILLLLVIFRPQKIDLGGGMVPVQYYNECRGLYLETYNTTPVDGTRGGWCFGKIEQKENLGYEKYLLGINDTDTTTLSPTKTAEVTTKQPQSTTIKYEQDLHYDHSKDYVHVDGGQDFAFNQDYKIHIEDTYSGGDFPSHRKFMLFKKGDIVQGIYDSKSCSGNGCTPTVRYVIVSVYNITRSVDIAMLTPVK